MFDSIFTRTLWERRRTIAIWTIAMMAFGLFMAYLYPSISADDTYAQLAENFEDSPITALFGEFDDLSNATGYIGAELYSFMMPLAAIIIGVGAGAAAIAKEESSGTLELLLSRPIARSKIIREKALALIVGILAMVAGTGFGLALGTLVVSGFEIGIASLFWVNIAVAMVGVVMGYFALMLTAFGLGRGAAVGITIASFIFMYFANTLPNLVSSLEPIQPVSVMYYFDYRSILAGHVPVRDLLILATAALVMYGVAQWRFATRDTGV